MFFPQNGPWTSGASKQGLTGKNPRNFVIERIPDFVIERIPDFFIKRIPDFFQEGETLKLHSLREEGTSSYQFLDSLAV